MRSLLQLMLCLAFLRMIPAANVTEEIMMNAAADNIDLSPFEFQAALNEISELWVNISLSTGVTYSAYASVSQPGDGRRPNPPLSTFLAGGKRIDVHSMKVLPARLHIINGWLAHVIPNWYRTMVPVSAGNSTPAWDLASFISFMDLEQVDKAIISFSEPSANVHLGNKSATTALARLMNEQAAAYCAAHSDRLKFNAIVPLPYTLEAVKEAQYAINRLGAAGIFLTSNFEGVYLGNIRLKPFFQALDAMYGQKVVFIHPGPPYIKYDDQFLIEANPTSYQIGEVEFYFEMARALMDLTLSGSLQNFTSINYIVPYAGGAFPATIDRFLRSHSPIYNSSLQILQTRLWWDSAGPTFDHQVGGLLNYGIPKSQIVFGSDYPYASPSVRTDSLNAILKSSLLTEDELTALFSTNIRNAFSSVKT